jgi:hypothetical protein
MFLNLFLYVLSYLVLLRSISFCVNSNYTFFSTNGHNWKLLKMINIQIVDLTTTGSSNSNLSVIVKLNCRNRSNCDLRQVVFSGYSGFLHKWNWPSRYSWKNVESGIKYHNPLALTLKLDLFLQFNLTITLKFDLEDPVVVKSTICMLIILSSFQLCPLVEKNV